MQTPGWRPTPIAEGKRAYVSSERVGSRTIRRGLQFSDLKDDLGSTACMMPRGDVPMSPTRATEN